MRRMDGAVTLRPAMREWFLPRPGRQRVEPGRTTTAIAHGFQSCYGDSFIDSRGKRMRHSDRPIALAMIFAVAAILLAGCGAKKVAGKTYVDDDGDSIEFRADRRAAEINWNPQVLYPGQQAALGSTVITNTTGGDFKLGMGNVARSDCTYKQDRDQIAVTCIGRKTATYTVNPDDSLTGPPEGMWAHAVFAHLVPKE